MVILRSLFFHLFIVIFTIFHWLLIVSVTPFLSFERACRLIVFWNTIYLKAIKLICGVDYKIIGEENIPAKNVLILSNHQSDFETIFLQMKFQPQATVLKKELLKIPFFGWSLKLLNPIAIDRSQKSAALKQLLTEGSKRLNDGFWVVIYPEGTRRKPEERAGFSGGGAMLAVKSGVPVLPVAHNAGRYCPGKKLIKRPGTITFVFGELIETTGRRAQDVNKDVEKWIHSKMDAIA